MSRDPFWRSKVVRRAIIAVVGLLALGAANIVRGNSDDIAALQTAHKVEGAVQAEVNRQILSDLHAIKTHLGIPQ